MPKVPEKKNETRQAQREQSKIGQTIIFLNFSPWKDFGAKDWVIMDAKRPPVLIPRNHIGAFILEQGEELLRK
jgi:hypothetical protein